MVAYLVEKLRENPKDITIGSEGETTDKDRFIFDIERACGFWKHYREGKGHHIGLIAENSYLWLVQCMGIIASGNIVVAYNYFQSEADLKHLTELSDTEALVCDGGSADEYSGFGMPVLEFPEAMSEVPEAIEENPEDEVVAILFSSGTGGKSKPVPLTKRNFSAYGLICPKEACGETTLMPLPLYHISGLYCYYDLVKGNDLIISSAKRWLRDIERGDITRLFVVPGMLNQLFQKLDSGTLKYEKLESLKNVVSLGAALTEAQEERLLSMGIRLEVFYGLTETTGLISGPGGEYRKGSSGKIMPYVEVRTEDGEIVVKGPNVMGGYYKLEAQTEAVLKDSWMYTGDMGRTDEDGYLYISGRKKNIIILGNGENVSPEELEEKLYRCPLVLECRVYENEGRLNADICMTKGELSLEEEQREIERFVKTLNKSLPLTHRITAFRASREPLEKTATGKLKRD